MNNTKHILLYLKWLISISSIAFIVFKFSKLSAEQFSFLKNAVLGTHGLLLMSAISLLMLVNWAIEALKWKMLVKHIQVQSFLAALKSVFIGVTIGLFTPNRAGELIGRVYFIEDDKKLRASLINSIGSLAQVACTFGFGIMALLFFKENWISKIPFTTLLSLALLLITISIALYYVVRNNMVLQNIIREIVLPFRRIDWTTVTQVVGLSILRYLIFTIQFVLVLQVFTINLSISEMLICIAVNYFLITVIPTYALAEIGVRGTVATAVFGVYGIDALPVISASLIVWMINLAVPALIGTAILMKE
jgi:hypothetical protein